MSREEGQDTSKLSCVIVRWSFGAVLGLGIINGVYTILQFVFNAAGRSTPVWAMAILPLMLIPSVNRLHDQASVPLHPAWENYYSMGEWLRRNESNNVVVSCGKPALSLDRSVLAYDKRHGSDTKFAHYLGCLFALKCHQPRSKKHCVLL